MLKGVLLKIGATIAFALMSALIKLASPAFPVSEIVFFRSVFAMATLAAWLAQRGEWPSALKTTRPFGHIGRSLAGSCGIFGNFLALAFLPLADAAAFTFVTPLMIALLASVVLGEAVSLVRAAAVAAGFLGVLVMLSGQLGHGPGDASGIGATAALIGASAGAVAMIQTQRLTQSEATGAIVFYFSSVTAVVSLAILVAAAAWPAGGAFAALAQSQRFVIPGPLAFVDLAAIGLLGGCGQILMTHCYRFADASVVASFDYLSMIWAATLGYLLFAELPSAPILMGAAIVIAAGGGLLASEHRRGRMRSAAGRRLAPAPPESFDKPDALT